MIDTVYPALVVFASAYKFPIALNHNLKVRGSRKKTPNPTTGSPGQPTKGPSRPSRSMAAEPAKRPVASPARVDMFTPVTKSPPIKSPEQKRIKVGPEEEVETPSPSPETCSMGASPEVKTPREDLSASFDASAAVDKTPVSANSSRVKDIMVSCTNCFIFLGW